jgi:pimeloyl-ACP methyl ester carboxylesterase
VVVDLDRYALLAHAGSVSTRDSVRPVADPAPSVEQIDTGELSLRVTLAGPQDGPPVVLLHGFPELAYSWRHQLPALAGAGYRVIAPDVRGHGGSDAPEPVEAYDILRLTGDVVALLDVLGIERSVVIGHDWGADTAWKTAWIHPERISAVGGLSVPYVPRAPAPPLDIMRRHLGEDFYIVWFQEPGVADAALARDVRRTLATPAVWDAAWAADTDDDPPTPRWLGDEALAVYVREYERTGFTPGLNLYRNIDRNWRITEPYDERRIEQPALYLAGSRDPAARFMPPAVMDGHVTDLRESVIVEGAGHWVQQQRPDEVNAALLRFLRSLAA